LSQRSLAWEYRWIWGQEFVREVLKCWRSKKWVKGTGTFVWRVVGVVPRARISGMMKEAAAQSR
jgi:hypothetical protein